MSWDGTGNFVRNAGFASGANVWEQAEQADRDIRADDQDTHDQDLADGLENCLTRDGQNSPNANLPMNGKKHTGVANADEDDQYAAWGQVKTRIAAPITFEPLTWASPLAWDVQAIPRGTLLVTGNIASIDLSNAADGGIYVGKFQQDPTGGRTIVFPAAWRWPNGGDAPTFTAAANAIDLLTLMVIDSDIYAVLAQDWQTA